MDGTRPIERPAKPRPSTLNTKACNDWLALDGVDNRTGFARRFRDLAVRLVRDLGLDDLDAVGDSIKLQIRSAALLAVQVEQLQAQTARGDDVDLSLLVKMQNSLARSLWALGLGKRKRQDLTPADALQAAARHQGGA
jgi:hypothetical protein